MELIARFLSAERFKHECIDAGQPGVLTGGISEWPALSLWTPDHLAARLGDRPCDVAFSADGNFDYVNASSLKRRLTFRCAAEQILRGPPEGGSLYLMQVSLDQHLPELAADIRAPAVLPDTGMFPFFWFGAAGNVTPVHYDGVNNLYGQVLGRKRFTLFDPADSEALYPRAVGSAASHLGGVDVERPDFARFPLYRRAAPRRCELEPGDLLFLPAFFWHHVRSLDTAVSVNFWWAPRLEQCLVPPFLRQLRVSYARDKLASVGAPIANYPGGLAGAAARAAQLHAPEFAVLFAGAAIATLPREEGQGAGAGSALAQLDALVARLADPVAAGADSSLEDADQIITALVAFQSAF
jgi:hypothetical protein